MQTAVKKKMLYIMGVDWDWIYQRPHVVAEYLSKDYDVTVAYPVKIWDRHVVKKPERGTVDIHRLRLWTFPFQRKCKLISKIADQYKRIRLRNYQRYEYVYISYPTDIEYIPTDYKGFLIYDCIDDYEQMCPNDYLRRKVEEAEKVLLQRSNTIIVSSQNLLWKKMKIYNRKPELIRNGTAFKKIYDVKQAEIKPRYIIGYIGTIAEWFDYDLIINSSLNHEELEYHLIGPCTAAGQMQACGIVYEGIVEHDRLQWHVKDYDCMIMPFIVNEIVAAVDPVKLYEYIAFGKCIVSVYYEELEYFKDYVYFYRTEKEYEKLMEKLTGQGFPPKYDKKQQEAFLAENSWRERYQEIHRLIETME